MPPLPSSRRAAIMSALLLSTRNPDRALERARALGAEALNPSLALVSRELIRDAHREGLAVFVYTVDAVDDMRRLIDWGADGLFTNHPARMRQLLDGGDAGGGAPAESG